MPYYTFKDKNTGEVFEKNFSFAERDSFLKDNPHMEQGLCAPALGDSVRLGVKRVDDNFKDVLKQVKKHNRGSTVNTF